MRAARTGGSGTTAGAGATFPARALLTTFSTFSYLFATGTVGFSITLRRTFVRAFAGVLAGVAFFFIGKVN